MHKIHVEWESDCSQRPTVCLYSYFNLRMYTPLYGNVFIQKYQVYTPVTNLVILVLM